MGRFIDLTGQQFGRLIVIKRAEDYVAPNGIHQVQWLCKCLCDKHSIIIAKSQNLRNGNTKSCGCLQKERVSKANKKYNHYDLSGEYGIGYDCNGKKFYFDLEDYNLIKDYCWCIGMRGYVNAYVENGVNISMHKLIMNPKNGLLVDHIHGKDSRHDNRKSNLRIATDSQNQMNRGLIKSNTSGITGVCWDKSRNKWLSQIKINNKTHRKRFDKFDDAVAQRKKWEEEFFGEFSYDKSMSL